MIHLITTIITITALAAPVRATPCERATELLASMRAPCDGTLVAPEQLRWLLQVETELRRVTAERAADQALARTTAAATARLEVQFRAEIETLATLRDEAELAAVSAAPSWYESPWLWLSVGVLAGATTTYAIIR